MSSEEASESHAMKIDISMLDLTGPAVPSSGAPPTLDKSQSVEITFKKLSYFIQVPDKEQQESQPKLTRIFGRTPIIRKQILNDVTGMLQSGKLTAIMGPSGAGKTSLLQVLSGEAKTGAVSGRLEINGHPATPADIKRASAFVFQDDVILSTMTVREALTMAAILRLPGSLSDAERKARVDQVISVLKLEKASNVIVGDAQTRGVSGGERKRVAIGMELISDPRILFLDEPTSGLDSFTASKVVEILKQLAETGRTVVATIHQPSAETFFMFDNLLLLSEGSVMYHGPVHGVLDHFKLLGHQVPLMTNPIDWIFMNVLSVFTDTPYPPGFPKPDGGPELEPAQQRIRRLLAMWPGSPPQIALQAKLLDPTTNTQLPSRQLKSTRSLLVQLGYLLGRTARNASRNSLVLKTKFIQSVVFGLIMGLTFFNIPGMAPSAALQNYSGILFFMATIHVMNNTTGTLNVFGEERAVFRREHGASMYGLPAFYWSKILIEAPMAFVFAFLLSTIIYWLAGMPANAGTFFVSMTLCGLSGVAGMFIGVTLASVFESLQVALSLAPMIIMPLMLYSGLFINSESIPPYFVWIKYISPVKYTFEGLVKTIVPQFTVPLGFDDGLSVGIVTVILLAFCLALVFVSYAGLWRITWLASKSAKWVSSDV